MARQIDKPICTNPGCHWKRGHSAKDATSARCSHLLHNVGWSSRPLRIALNPSTTWDGALLIALLSFPPQRGMEPCASSEHSGAFPELFGFPPPSPVWVGRFFTKSTKSTKLGFSSNWPGQAFYYHSRPHLISLWFSSSAISLG